MNYPRILQVAIIFVLVFFTSPLLAASEGELYWAVGSYPDQHFPRDAAKEYHGGLEAIDAACRKNAGAIGTYTGTVRILNSSGNYPALKIGYCQNTRIFYPVPFDGAMYLAVLHCNGVAREMMDDSDCKVPTPPEPPLPPSEPNLGNFYWENNSLFDSSDRTWCPAP